MRELRLNFESIFAPNFYTILQDHKLGCHQPASQVGSSWEDLQRKVYSIVPSIQAVLHVSALLAIGG